MNRFIEENVLRVFDRIAHYIPELMSYRLQDGNTKSLDVALLPDTTPEGEAAGYWHTYRQPKAVSQ